MIKRILFLMITVISGLTVRSQANLVADSSFEGGAMGGIWTEFSTNFGTPICDQSTCGTCLGECLPRTGTWYAWFGGADGTTSPFPEIGRVSQNITIPNTTTATLKYHVKLPIAAGHGNDSLIVKVDGVEKWHITDHDSATYQAYTPVTLDLTAQADGGSHEIMFYSRQTGPGTTNILVDDVSLRAQFGVGISYDFFPGKVSIYPNPATDMIVLDLDFEQIIDL